MTDDPITIALSASLLYGSYTMVSCPCKVPCRCKYWSFVLATGVPLGYVIYKNMS
jgi:hypothetical protein